MSSQVLKLTLVLTLTFVLDTAVAITDPMQPPGYQGITSARGANTTARWTLSSVLISEQRRLATLNGKIVAVGEKVNGARLIEIMPAAVKISYQGRKIVVKLLPLVVKQQRKNNSE